MRNRADRRRKAGTRVAAEPVAKARLDIALLRHEVEGKGATYGYHMIERTLAVPPVSVSAAMKTRGHDTLLHIRALHLSDAAPYAIEDRWINIDQVLDARAEKFQSVSANEWLLKHVPYTHGDIAFSAVQATPDQARILAVPNTSALFAIDRITWDDAHSVTKVILVFAPGYQLRTSV